MPRDDSQAILCQCPKCRNMACHVLTRHGDDVYYECGSCHAHSAEEQFSQPMARVSARHLAGRRRTAKTGVQKAAKQCLACGKKFIPERPRVNSKICDACATACRICGGTHLMIGLCRRHYLRWLRASKPPLASFIAAEK